MKYRLLKTLPVVLFTLLYSGAALAQEAHTATGGDNTWKGLLGLGIGLAMGLAVHGAGQGQGNLAAKALEGMARNPQAGGKIQISMILALVFPESLVLFTMAVAYLLLLKIV